MFWIEKHCVRHDPAARQAPATGPTQAPFLIVTTYFGRDIMDKFTVRTQLTLAFGLLVFFLIGISIPVSYTHLTLPTKRIV